MEPALDPTVVGNEFDKWLDYNGAADESNDQYMRAPSELQTASGLPISPISTANSDSFTTHYKATPYTAPYTHDLPTPTNSSSSPETHHNPYRLSGDTLRSDSSFMSLQPNLKRKLSPNDGSGQEYKPVAGRPLGSKRPHNVIEKRYRANLNEKIAELRDSVPSLRALKKAKGKQGKETQESSDEEDLEGLAPSSKLNKASILTKAVEYIRHLEYRNKNLEEENRALKERLQVLDKVLAEGGNDAARASAFTSETTIEQSPQVESSDIEASGSEPKPEIKGLIGIPDSMKSLRNSQPQEHYGHVYSTPTERSRLSGKWPQRIMLGSLAGLMVMEAVSEPDAGDDSQQKALFGIPIEILDGWTFLRSPRIYLATFMQYCRAGGVVPLIKGFFALTILAFLVFYYMFNSKPPPKKQQDQDLLEVTEAAARPASPIEVRRRAWSTSMQALGLPHHSFFPEWFAVTSEWVNYSIRYWLGQKACLWLCGETVEDEIARIKAWDIAIDAQLAGGDVEVSRSRTVLTIFGSGTLPATPLRLMMKAIHTKIVLHNVGIAGTLSSKVASRIATFIANRQWRRARQMHETLHPRDQDRLPGYLNYLLQMDCDDVFSSIVTQRAYNLMYDRPTSEYAADVLMDVVVEDHAIRSPLDAVAAWRSTSALREALNTALQSPDAADLLREHIQAALEIAPPGSAAETRALAVHAVLSPGRRHTFYLRAADAVTSNAGAVHNNAFGERIPYFIDSSTPASARPEISAVLFCAETMLKLDQERNLFGAVELFSELQWPDLRFGASGPLTGPTILSTTTVYFVLTRLLRASRKASDCSSSSCEHNLRPLPQLTHLAQKVYQHLCSETVRVELHENQKAHLTPALDTISCAWDMRPSSASSRRQSSASHDTGYGSLEEMDNPKEYQTAATYPQGNAYVIGEVDALTASV